MTISLQVANAFTGDSLCELDLAPDETVLQLREKIQAATGIQWNFQRILVGGRELQTRDQTVLKALDGAAKVELVVRRYDRQEMQAAWLIEGVWRRRRALWDRRAAAGAAGAQAEDDDAGDAQEDDAGARAQLAALIALWRAPRRRPQGGAPDRPPQDD
mmetsp:Transcript_9381/g.20860  ORF Transcript_9381/g.20860 Transcript_9381/m.20860 type:complete len:159 (+) Transcript_9381:53-529(+)|eukprot:CAMPEP_0170609982 /NCGR_PEP_ID=MMETSP0224-20130122/22411_1 /TAXON_ID=285029 /ORGANISM="Togula jolla, Strain CCCM 725" /LENGTH=158 /DNA_ID=CAMNT_0010935317 /DNA_START=44 /DNA_END=520 /DNA_ORIENTATION=-